MASSGHLDITMGVALIGVVVAATLYGVTLVQGWYYFTHQDDRWPLKLLVSAVLCFETIHQALITHTIYSYLVTNYGNPVMLGNAVWSVVVEVLFNGLTALLVQSFLTLRIWRLSGHHILLTGSVLSLVLSEFACMVAFTSKSLRLSTFLQINSLKGLSITINALGAATDVLIAASLCVMLHRSRTGFQRLDTMINKLMMFAVNTGVLTSLCATTSLITILVAQNSFLYIAFFFCLGRFYSNSLLATLNARKKIRSAADCVNINDNISLCLRDLPTSQGRADISIKIDTAKELTSDHDHAHSVLSDTPGLAFKAEAV